MKAERYKAIMQQVGMPDSQSLLSALQQVANETAQEINLAWETQAIDLIKDWRAEIERRWSPDTGYPNDFAQGYSTACNHHTDDLEKLLKKEEEE